MKDFFRLIRYKNLLIVAFTQIVVYVTVNVNFLSRAEMHLTPGLFFLLMLSTVIITGAGYIINDYFDVKIDSINKPEFLIIGNTVPAKRAVLYHNVMNISAVIIAGFVAYRVGQPWLFLFQVGGITLLWFYSTHFKKMSVIGNVVVSVMTAMSVLVLLFFEPALYDTSLFSEMFRNGSVNPALHIIVVAVFAFLLNWMREIIKDIEDLKGDHELGCKTYPIVHGLKKSIQFVQVLNVITMLILILSMLALFTWDKVLSGLVLLLPFAGLMYFGFKLPQLSTFRQFGRLSRLLKWLMVIGLLDLLIIVYF